MRAHMSSWRDAALREMGLGPIWRRRDQAAQGDAAVAPATLGEAVECSASPAPPAPVAALASVAPPAAAVPPAVVARTAAAAAPTAGRAARPLPSAAAPSSRPVLPAGPTSSTRAVPGAAASGAQVGHPATRPQSDPDARADAAARSARIATLDWAALEDDIRACRACVLCERRKQAVPGVGDRQARWMFVGEGPGAEEDQRGEPFVGQAGRLLDNMLAAIGLERGKGVYVANAVKCRPPHNRTPERAELTACLPYLERQIALVQPTLLIALGRPAAQALLDRDVAISAARGKRFERKGIPVVVTYHPAYLLRNPQDKAKAWEDLCYARRLMGGEG